MQRIFIVFILQTAWLSVLTANAYCPDCQNMANPGAEGGVRAKCGETNSVKPGQGIHGLCELLVELLNNDETENQTKTEANILSVANDCLTGQPMALNARLSNEIQTFRERSEFMQRQIDRNLPEGSSEGFASLFSPEDLTILFSLIEASGITGIGLDHLEKVFFTRVGWISIEVKPELTSYDWKQLRNERRFFAYLYYIVLRQQQADPEAYDSLTRRLGIRLRDYGSPDCWEGDGRDISSLFAAEHVKFESHIEYHIVPSFVLDMTSSWGWKRFTQYLNPQGWTMMFLQPRDWILRSLQERGWNFLGRYCYIQGGTSFYGLAAGIWILLSLNDDQTVTLFTNYGMGMITLTQNDLGSLLEGLQSNFSHSNYLTSEPPLPGDQLQK